MNASTIESTISTEQVRTALQQVGYGTYSQYAGALANVLNSLGVNRAAVLDFARDQGYGHLAPSTADSFISALHGTESTSDQPDTVEVSAETACEVIRAFLIEEEGYTEEEVSALLVLAGLEDERIAEPKVEEAQAPDDSEFSEAPSSISEVVQAAVREAVAPLVAFARRHGFEG